MYMPFKTSPKYTRARNYRKHAFLAKSNNLLQHMNKQWHIYPPPPPPANKQTNNSLYLGQNLLSSIEPPPPPHPQIPG